MFWEYGISVSSIDALLDRDPPPTLEEVINEPDIIQEIKANNEKVISFIVDTSNFKELLNILKSNNFKLSKISKEIICSGATVIDDAIFDDAKTLGSLWSVISDKNSIGPAFTHAILIFEYYLLSHPRELFSFFSSENIDFFDGLIERIGFESICDLLFRFVTLKIDNVWKQIAVIFIEKDVPKILINKLFELNESRGALYVLSELINHCRNGISLFEEECCEKHILQTILNDEIIISLIKHIVDTENQDLACSSASLLCIIFNLQRNGDVNGEEFLSPSNIPVWTMNNSKKSFVEIIPHLESLFSKLKHLVDSAEKLGRLNILIIEFFVSLTLYNDEELSVELSRLEVPFFLIDLFEKFPEHNILHCLIELSLSSLLLGIRWKTPTGALLYINNNLFYLLFKDEIFVTKLMSLLSKKENYSAHVRQIYRSFRKATTDSFQNQFLAEKIEAWSMDLKGELAKNEELIQQIDAVEAIDSRFLRVMNIDMESNFVENDNKPFITLEKAVETFKKEFAELNFNDNTENIEKRMNLNIDTQKVPNKFDEMRISIPPLEVFQEKSDSFLNHVHDVVHSKIIKTDSAVDENKFSMAEMECGIDTIEASIKNTIIIPDNNQKFLPADSTEEARSSQSTSDMLFIPENRCATSSPLSGNSKGSSVEDNTFDDDNYKPSSE